MWNQIRVKHKHLFANLNRKRKKSGKKEKQTIEWYISLLAKENKEWLTKWIQKTKQKAEDRIKKYSITKDMINTVIKSKWLNDLLIK